MTTSLTPRRRASATLAVAAVASALLTFTAPSATAVENGSDGVVATGPDWAVSRVAGGYQVTLDLSQPLPVVDDAPTIAVDGVDLGLATESADGGSLSLTTSDPAVVRADKVTLGWSTGSDSKATPTDSTVTSKRAKVQPDPTAVLPSRTSGGTSSERAPSAAALQRAAGDDGSSPGPYSYEQDDYDYGDQAIGLAAIGNIRGELTGRIYLSDAPGPRPTIILLHGRHTSCATVVTGTTNLNRWPCVAGQVEVPSYEGYDGTGQTLATWGYDVVSISANAINANDNQLALDYGAEARGQLVIDSLRMIGKWNAGDTATYHDTALNRDLSIEQALDVAPPTGQGGTPDLNQLDAADLVGRFDLTHVGLMGHSRGGEGVTSAVTLNQALAQPFGIESVLPLAPVDFSRMTVGQVPMLVMLPYCDGDVSNQQGQHFIDDSRYAFNDDRLLSTIYVMGADHNFFNTVWTPGKYPYSTSDDWSSTATGSQTSVNDSVCGTGNPSNQRLSSNDQYDVGTALMSAWFRMTVPSSAAGADTSFLPQFDGSAPQESLSSVPAADLRVIGQAPSSARVDIDSFTTNDGRIRATGTATASICASSGQRAVSQPFPACATANTVRSTSAMPHWTPASFAANTPASPMLKYTWRTTTGTTAASIALDVPAPARNAAAHQALVFKTAPEETVTSGTDMTVTAVDANGATWSSKVSALNPRAVNRMPASGSTTLNKIVLQEVSIPVASMTGIDTSKLAEVRFAGAVGADGTDTGGVYLSDLALADSAVGTPALLADAPTVNLDPTTVEEGDDADTAHMAVVLSHPAATTVSAWFNGTSASGSTTSAATATKVIFSPGQTCKAVAVPLYGDTTAGTAATTPYKGELALNSGVVYGAGAFQNLTIREDDGTVAAGSTPAVAPAPAVGAQGDVCAEYAAKQQSLALSTSLSQPGPGDTVTLTGSGFRAGESVSFTDASTSPATVIARVIAGADGTASAQVTLPANATLGDRSVVAVGAGSARTESVVLAVRAATTTAVTLATPSTVYGQGSSGTVTVTGASGGVAVVTVGDVTRNVALDATGTGSFSLPGTLTAGSYTVTAQYAGSPTLATSRSTTTYRVAKAGVSMKLKLLTHRAQKGYTRVKVRATVSASSAGAAPSGTVTFKLGARHKTVAVPASGSVTVLFTTKGRGVPNRVKSTYSGDVNHLGATARTATHL